MMLRTFLAASVLGLTALNATAGPEAEAVISETAVTMSKSESPSDAITDKIDVEAVAAFTLGKYSRRVSDGERDRFADALEAFLAQSFEDQKHLFTKANVIVTGSIDRSERDSIVETRVERPGKTTETVRWRVMKRDGGWKVVDVEWQGLWLAIEQRAQIAAIMDKPRATIDDAIRALKG